MHGMIKGIINGLYGIWKHIENCGLIKYALKVFPCTSLYASTIDAYVGAIMLQLDFVRPSVYVLIFGQFSLMLVQSYLSIMFELSLC